MAKFQEHQQRVIDKLNTPDNTRGVIAYHSLGSGKTLTALGAFDTLLKDKQDRGLFIVPASLVENAYKEMDKHGLGHLRKKVDVLSYDKASNRALELLRKRYKFVAIDEAHRLRNRDTSRAKNITPIVRSADKTLMLTGTAGYNHPADMGALINILDGNANMPDTPRDFENEYINNVTWKLKNKEYLQSLLKKYIDRYETPTNNGDFPRVTRKVIPVEMSKRQAALYRLVERDIPEEIRNKLRNNLPMTLQDTTKLNVFATGIRQVSDSGAHHDVSHTYHDSPKILRAATSMVNAAHNNPGFRGVLYSNYIDAGITPYKNALQDAGIKPLVFTGSLSQAQKKELIDSYNSKSKKPQVLILSSSGAEGLDLKNTQLMQILEPHFNKSKIRQAEGRAIRYKSHASLPVEKQHVLVEEYQSTLPKTFWQRLLKRKADAAIDTYLADASERKDAIIQDINKLL